jgi:glycine/D-amino acid oxidase-like deaminating enzyme
MNIMQSEDLIVVGGGVVGAAIAYGAARIGAAVTLLDQGDVAHRASRGNFGLVWVQSKGEHFPRYARWCRDAVKLWPGFARELAELTGVDVALHQPGGFWIGFTDSELSARQAMLSKLNETVGEIPFEMLDHSELKARLPEIGNGVAGGSFCPLDGHVNPLLLLHALHAGLNARGATLRGGIDVQRIRYRPSTADFEVASLDGKTWRAKRVVLAAGLGNRHLASQVGLHAPVVPNRGQVLITERLKPFLPYPTNKARQTNEGSVQLGYSVEDVGFDDGTTVSAIQSIAKRATKTFPILSSVRLVRAWGALRVMTPDGFPIYQESSACPGAFVATSHSGVSLAATHALVVGPWMAGRTAAPEEMEGFAGERFLDTTRVFSNAH